MTITSSGAGGGARAYNQFRGALYSGGSSTPTYPGQMKCGSYNKTAGTADSETAQGPSQMVIGCSFKFAPSAGDQLAIEWKSYLQGQATADLVPADSGILVEVQ